MKLFFKKTGEGKPLIILHGLFGLSDNWATLSKSFVENGFCVYAVDLRNHGRSPHSFDFTLENMADDLNELMIDEQLGKADVIGHSMGGKVAMYFALKYPEKINKLVVADIAPRYYEKHHQAVFEAIESVDLNYITSRKEAEEGLRNVLSDEATIQFLLKNLYWNEEEKLSWRFGYHEIEKNIENIGQGLPANSIIDVPALFVRGEQSGYINENDRILIKQMFPQSVIKTVPNAGHWVHAENPKIFFETVLNFLDS